ncbi:MAG: hypothetical protein JZD41_03630 [Thermoproteus sp.]|nr:hypothetical protein [Thermoproteus sp.]
MIVNEFNVLTENSNGAFVALKQGDYYVAAITKRGVDLIKVSQDFSSASVVKSIQLVPGSTFAYAIWNSYGRNYVDAYLVYYGGDGSITSYKARVTPGDITADKVASYNAGAHVYSTLDSTITYPRIWYEDSRSTENCISMIDMTTGKIQQFGCYGPAGYNIWPMVTYNGPTQLGNMKALLSSHHYWIVGAYAYLHIMNRYTGTPATSVTNWDSCSGAFSANDKFVGGPWHGKNVAWGRSGGIGSQPCFYVFDVPYTQVNTSIRSWPGFPRDMMKAFIPIDFNNNNLLFLSSWNEYTTGKNYVVLGTLNNLTSPTPIEKKEVNMWHDHESTVSIYDLERNAFITFGATLTYLLVVAVDNVRPYPTTLSRTVPRAYVTSTNIKPYVWGRATWCPDEEGQCTMAGTGGGPTQNDLWKYALVGAFAGVISGLASR